MIFFGSEIKNLLFNGSSFSEAYLGPDLVWKAHYEPVTHKFTEANTYYVDVPRWADTLDYVVFGGGGGGCAGGRSPRENGEGGYSGRGRTGTTRVSQGRMTVVVGAGGYGSTQTNYPAESGEATSISIGGTRIIANGGRGGRSSSSRYAEGGARGEVNVPGFRLPKGSEAPIDSPGIHPGDGGGGGSGKNSFFGSASPGQNGADGLAWIRFRKS
ncbi:hypothetical protein CHUV2995_00996 [Corynebacterium diphtheriae subsp. lausannense]|nr:hypothetical protein CHUV2995_00996 [Corynebacterium diphtheriae subsp. lausannense]